MNKSNDSKMEQLDNYRGEFILCFVGLLVTIFWLLIQIYISLKVPKDMFNLNPFSIGYLLLFVGPFLSMQFRFGKWAYQNPCFSRQEFVCRILGVMPVYLLYLYWILSIIASFKTIGAIRVDLPFYFLSIFFIPAMCRMGYKISSKIYGSLFHVTIKETDIGD